MKHDAVMGSPPRYALVLSVSFPPPDLMRRINTRIVNIAARGVGGLSRRARTGSLQYTAVATTVYNLPVRLC